MMRARHGSSEFLLFSLVGVAGFFVDAGTLYFSSILLGLNPYLGRLVSYLAAATTTWQLNRRFTFPFADTRRPHRQWAKFVATNAIGGIVNYGVYVAIIINSPHTPATLMLAVAAGSLSGLVFNFFVSKHFVFSRTWKEN
jgi:putative flippase GtrA